MTEYRVSDFYKKSWRLSHLYKIVDYQGHTIKYKRNKAQQYFAAKKLKMKQEVGRVRMIILKGRQQGMTTDACITNLDEALLKHNRNVVITAHKEKKQKEIFQKVQYAYDNFPSAILLKDGNTFYKPKTKLENVNQLFFKKNNSQIKVALDARSGTATDMHITELAFRNDAEEMMAGTLPAAEGADIVIETTANGVGNYFHQLRMDNYNNPDGTWRCVFLGWWMTPQYATPLGPGEIINLPPELKHLDKIVTEEGKHLTQEQKKRYWNMWKTLKKLMFQEYPSSPEEAFLNTGDTVREATLIKGLDKLDYTIDSTYRQLRIYAQPTGICMYGIDTAEGGPNGDFSAISVRDANLNLLAFYYEKIPPDELVKVIRHLFDLGYIGLIAPERNNTGLTTISKIKEDPLLFSFLLQEQTLDKKTNTYTQKLGWHTNAKTRPYMTGEYEEAIREGFITQVDERLRAEMYTFVYNNHKKMVASAKCHDDAIMCDAICYQMRKEVFKYISL